MRKRQGLRRLRSYRQRTGRPFLVRVRRPGRRGATKATNQLQDSLAPSLQGSSNLRDEWRQQGGDERVVIGRMFQEQLGLEHGRCAMCHQRFADLAPQLVPALQEQGAETGGPTAARQLSQLPDLQHAQLFQHRHGVRRQAECPDR